MDTNGTNTGTAGTTDSTSTTTTAAVATIGNSSIPAVPVAHASILHTIFSELEKFIGLAGDPAVVGLLPAKYQAYAGAAVLVEQVIAGAVSANAAPAPAAS